MVQIYPGFVLLLLLLFCFLWRLPRITVDWNVWTILALGGKRKPVFITWCACTKTVARPVNPIRLVNIDFVTISVKIRPEKSFAPKLTRMSISPIRILFSTSLWKTLSWKIKFTAVLSFFFHFRLKTKESSYLHCASLGIKGASDD